jgi:small acid-soluble spore protein (thioredoxin-like protein)
MKNRPKPDDRSDNVDRIQENIDNTIQNIELGEDAIAHTDNPKTKRELEAKNRRREEALDGMRREIKDEADDRDQGLS